MIPEAPRHRRSARLDRSGVASADDAGNLTLPPMSKRGADVANKFSSKSTQSASIAMLNKRVAPNFLGPEPDDNIPRELCCGICWELMVRPTHCAPCMHSFCEHCLRRVCRASNGRFRCLCPYCRQTIRYTLPNKGLENYINASLPALNQNRLEWLEGQREFRKMPLPGFAPLGFISRCCPLRNRVTLHFVNLVEQKLFFLCALFTLQLSNEHFNRAAVDPILTTIADLCLVAFFRLCNFPPDAFLTMRAYRFFHPIQPPANHPEASVEIDANADFSSFETSRCADTLKHLLLYLRPSLETVTLCFILCFILYFIALFIFCLRDPVRYMLEHYYVVAFLRSRGLWFYLLVLMLTSLWWQMLTCEILAHIMNVTMPLTAFRSQAASGVLAAWLGLACLLYLSNLPKRLIVRLMIVILVLSPLCLIGVFCFEIV